MEKKTNSIISTLSTAMMVATVVQKVSKGKAKDKDLKETQTVLGSINDRLEAFNDTVKFVGKVKKFLK